MAKCALFILMAILVLFSGTEANSHGRIIQGTPALNMQFPWHASLRITVSNSVHQSFCGGTLISEQFLLTAASCMRNVVTIQIDLGSVLFSSPLVTLHSNQFLIHPNYNANFQTNDISIIRMPHPIAVSVHIRPISIPSWSQASLTFDNAEVHIPGFGVTVPGGNIMSEQLYFAHKRVITNTECLQHFSGQFIQASTMCAVGINNSLQTPCFGDRGGGLVTFIENEWLLIGKTSIFHPSGCTGLTPAAYARITPHLQWISTNTGIPIRA